MRHSLEPQLRRLFYWYGFVVYKYRLLMIIIPICVTALSSYGLTYMAEMTIDDSQELFTPWDGRGLSDLAKISMHWPLDNDKFVPGKSFETKQWFDIVIKARDRKDVLRDSILDEVIKLEGIIANNISITKDDFPAPLTYQVLCLTYEGTCYSNTYLYLLKNRYTLGTYLDLRYPKGGQGEVPMYLGNYIAGVETDPKNGTILSANALRIMFFAVQSKTSEAVNELSRQWRLKVQDYLLHEYKSDKIYVLFNHYDSLSQGLQRNADRFTPNVITAYVVLTIFALLCSFVMLPPRKGKPFRGIDWVRSKPYLALLGVFSPFLAIMTSFGILLLLRQDFNVITTVMPFLVVSIGVDDMFILLSAWHRTTATDPVPQRMADTLGEGAVSITITSLTDALSFMIGCYTTLKGVQIFCIYTTVAIVLDYIYQLTFFLGIMCYVGDMERSGRHAISMQPVVHYRKSTSSFVRFMCRGTNWAQAEDPKPRKSRAERLFTTTMSAWIRSRFDSSQNAGLSKVQPKLDKSEVKKPPGKLSPIDKQPISQPPPAYEEKEVDPIETKDNHLAVNVPNSQHPHAKGTGTQGEPKKKESRTGTWVSRFFRQYYGPFIIHPVTRALAILSWMAYLAVAIAGTFYITEGLNPENLVPKDFYVHDFLTDATEFFEVGPQMHVLVENPPNITLHEGRQRLIQLATAFENMPGNYSYGRNGTMFWLFSYMDYLKQFDARIENTTLMWHTNLLKWLDQTGGRSLWDLDMVWSNDTDPKLKAFRFQVCLQNYIMPNDHKMVVTYAREIADSYVDLQVTVYEMYFRFADQYLMIMDTTLRNIGYAIACMVFVSFLLIPSIPCIIIIVLAIISIDVGVIGFMTWWDVNLDCVSMIGIIMSIGFAVDLAAHISYAYVTSEGTKKRRVVTALETLGWPVFQGAFSSIIGMLVLATVDAYMILTFFKTMFLVILFGMIHGLIYLPVALTVLLPQKLIDKTAASSAEMRAKEQKAHAESAAEKMEQGHGTAETTVSSETIIEANGFSTKQRSNRTEQPTKNLW